MSKTFYMDEANVDNLKKALIGHSITSVYYDKLTLDNDCILTIEDSCECCAHYSGEFNWDKQPPKNVITNVVLDDHIQVGYDEAFRIVVMAQDKKIADLSVIGNEGTGCYMKSVYFTVSKINRVKSGNKPKNIEPWMKKAADNLRTLKGIRNKSMR